MQEPPDLAAVVPPRALTFGQVAEQYERYRPGYRDELADAVLGYAQRPVRTALEVGAGTGKATRLFASRGITVTALEPDPAMAAVLGRVTDGLPVQVVVSGFEDWPIDRRFDLLYAAASWHWTDPATRFVRAADLLEIGGVLALFGRGVEPVEPTIREEVERIEYDVLGSDSSGGCSWTVEDAASTPGLVDATELVLPATAETTREDFVGRLATVSAYLLLPEHVRRTTLRAVAAAVPERLAVDVSGRLTLARRC